MATSPSLKREVNDLVLEQIHAFKQPADITDSQLLEYHLRHLQIMTLYRQLDRVAKTGDGPSALLGHADLDGHHLREMRDRVSDNRDIEQSYRLCAECGFRDVYANLCHLQDEAIISQERPDAIGGLHTRLRKRLRRTRRI